MRDGGLAFPFKLELERDRNGVIKQEYSYGMSLRDYFAAAALQGLLANGDFTKRMNVKFENDVPVAHEHTARICFDAADAMLKVRQP